jgi:hypothetical protein
MRFKLWLQENLAGPGGGPDMAPTDLVSYNKEIARKGAGAFPAFAQKDMPPKPAKSPTARYLDPRYVKNKPGQPGL